MSPFDDAMEVDENSSPSASDPSSDSHEYSPSVDRILFYHRHDPYYGFTNFSDHPVEYEGKLYPTSEHLFQSFKFQGHRPDLAEHLRTFSTRPSDVFKEARRFQPEVRPDWLQVNIEKMDETVYHKFTQHDDLLMELMGTGNAELVEDSDKDAFWGIGADHQGRNELGKSLMRLREKLRSESDDAGQPPTYVASQTMMAKVPSPSVVNQVPTNRARSTRKALCENCHQRPKYQNHPYCGKTCAAQAKTTAKASILCIQCHKRPKHGKHNYCGRTCAGIAKNRPSAFRPLGSSKSSFQSSILQPGSLRRKSSESIDSSPKKRAKPDSSSSARSKRDPATIIFNPPPPPKAPAPTSTTFIGKRNAMYMIEAEASARAESSSGWSDAVSLPKIKTRPTANPTGPRPPAVALRLPSSRTDKSSLAATSTDDEDDFHSCVDQFEDAPSSPDISDTDAEARKYDAQIGSA